MRGGDFLYYHSSTSGHRQAWRLALLLTVFLFPLPASAEEDSDAPADTVYVIPDIVIEAPRLEPDYKVTNRPGFVAVLDVSERRNRVDDLPAVLSKMVGVRVKQYGGLGSFATVSIRGSASNQVDLFLDGIPLGDAYLGVANIGDLPIDGIARVEVFRGFTPPHLGSSAMGGAVNLVTYDNDKWARGGLVSHVELHTSYGSFETGRQALSLWSGAGPVRLFVHGGLIESQGNFTYLHDNGTPHNLDDDIERARTNNDFTSLNVLGRLLVKLPVMGDVSLTHNAFEREKGVPGLGSLIADNARTERTRYLTYLQWVPPPLVDRRLRFEVDGFHSYTNEKFTDLGEIPSRVERPHRDLGPGRAPLVVPVCGRDRCCVRATSAGGVGDTAFRGLHERVQRPAASPVAPTQPARRDPPGRADAARRFSLAPGFVRDAKGELRPLLSHADTARALWQRGHGDR
jgi:outer membrane receptor protein involved in Fe transport